MARRYPDCWFNVYRHPERPGQQTIGRHWWQTAVSAEKASQREFYKTLYRLRIYLKPSSPNTGS